MSSDHGPSLGEYLRQERERRGITIEQVASATKISVRLLHSLEGDQFSELPAKPFIRGFVTSYARFINLDPQEILSRFDHYIDQRVHDRPQRDAGHSGYAFERREGEQSRTILWVLMGTFMVLGGVIVVFLKPSLHRSHSRHLDKLRAAQTQVSPSPSMGAVEPMPSATPGSPSASPSPQPKPTSQAAPVAAPEAAPSPTASAVATPSPSVSPKPDPLNSGSDLEPTQIKYKVVLKALDNVWVRYRVDEKPVMKFVLKKDKLLVLRALKEIRFQTSDPSLVNFNFNGRAAQSIGDQQNLSTRRGTPTLLFPYELNEKIKDPFPGERALPTLSSSSQGDASPSPSPSP